MPPNNPLSYDFNAPSMTQGPSREEMAARERQADVARAGIASAVAMPVTAAVSPYSLLLPTSETSYPAMGGLLGGLAPVVFPEARPVQMITQMASKAPAVARPFIPSLAGSTAGTTIGTLAEQITNPNEDLFSTETGKKLLGNLIENAIFDVGGNLAFSIGGKGYQVSKDMLSKAGLGSGGLLSNLSPDQQARIVAQEWLSKRGGTLTKGQLTGDQGLQQLEAALSVTPGGNQFQKQRETVEKLVSQGAKDVMATLDTSDAFKLALKQGDPTQLGVGDRFQAAIKTAEQTMKEKFAPVYEQLEKEGDGLFVNMKSIKDIAKQELDKLAKRKYAGSGEERATVLRQILEQDDQIPLSVAHSLRSDLLAGARDLQKEGVPTSAKAMEYTRQADNVRKQMDDIMVATFGNTEQKELARKLGMYGGIDSPAGLRSGQYLDYAKDLDTFLIGIGKTKATTGNNQLLRDYFNAQKEYRSAMEGFYNGTISAALKEEPSAVGAYLFNTDRPERTRDVFKAIAEAGKYLPPNQANQLNEELMYGFLSKAMATPDEILKFSKQLDNPEFAKTFNYLFKDPVKRKQITDVFNAAKYGFEETPGGTFLRTKLQSAAAGVGTTAVVGGGLYYAMPDKVKDNLNLPQELAGLSFLYFTPKVLARAMTSKEGMDALAGLAKAQTNPKFAGAAGAKIAKQLNDSGILDFESMKAVDQFIRAPQEQRQPTPSMSPLEYEF